LGRRMANVITKASQDSSMTAARLMIGSTPTPAGHRLAYWSCCAVVACRAPIVSAPIVGATKPHHLTEAAALDPGLTEEEIRTLEAHIHRTGSPGSSVASGCAGMAANRTALDVGQASLVHQMCTPRVPGCSLRSPPPAPGRPPQCVPSPWLGPKTAAR